MKKLGPTLLLLLAVGIIVLINVVFAKNRELSTMNDTISNLSYTEEQVDDLIETVETIVYLRQKKLELCELLGDDLPIKLLEICGMPE